MLSVSDGQSNISIFGPLGKSPKKRRKNQESAVTFSFLLSPQVGVRGVVKWWWAETIVDIQGRMERKRGS